MYVYILFEEREWEGTDIIGVYSTLAQARKDGTGVVTAAGDHPYFTKQQSVRGVPAAWSTNQFRKNGDVDDFYRHIERHKVVGKIDPLKTAR